MSDHTHILKHARVTEKAGYAATSSIYVFDVDFRATKRDIARAVLKLYKVVPVKVAIVTVRAKTVRSMRTGRQGVKKGGKKAYVYLKKGQTIALS